MLTRRLFSGGLGAALLGAAPRKPNVIVILTDDQGYGDFSGHKNPLLATPQLDRLAADGVAFTRFSVSPVCAPTRAALLTGRYPLRTGVHGVTKGRETMRANELTLGQAFQAAGYRTGLIGKWHLGENYPYVPHARGFDEFVGFRTGHWNWYFDSPVERNGKAAQLPGYIADSLTREAQQFVDRSRRDPFFLYLAYNTPHAPYQVPDAYFDRFAKRGLSLENQSIYGMVQNLDDNIGRLLAHLERRNLAEDTIVVFLCDNGPQTDRYNAGLRARKGSVYEGGTRSPLYVRYPAQLRGGRQIEHVAGHIDITPTLLDLCQVKRPPGPEMDGMSLRPLLEGRTSGWPERILFTHADHQPEPTRPYPGCARTQRFKMVNGSELYDLLADPGESRNVARDYPKELARLVEAYEKWFASTLEGFRPGAPPIPVGYRQENPATLSAPQAKLTGALRFYQRQGYAHDFVTGWSGRDDAMTWTVQPVRAGRYAVAIEYRAPAAGSWMSVSGLAGRKTRRGVEMAELPLPHRVHNGNEAPVVHWAKLDVGRLSLEARETEIELRVSGTPADIKSMKLLLE